MPLAPEGGPHRRGTGLRPASADHLARPFLHSRGAVADPEEARRSGEDKPTRCRRLGEAAPGRRAHGGVGARRGPRGDAGSGSRPRRRGRNPACSSPAGQQLHAQARPGFHAPEGLDDAVPEVAAGTEIRAPCAPDRAAGDGGGGQDLEGTRAAPRGGYRGVRAAMVIGPYRSSAATY